MKVWPASPGSLRAARALLGTPARGPSVIAADRDVDGLAAAVLTRRALERLGARAVAIVAAGKGEHPHHPALQARLHARRPDLLVVVDMGSRGGPILPGVPTVIIDHHQPRGFPPGAVAVSAFGHEPVAPTSLLAFELLRPLVAVDDLAWLAVLGTVADLGIAAPFPAVRAWLARHRPRDVTEAVALLNAARRAAGDEVEVALDVLERAASPGAIAGGRVAGVERLRACRRAVDAETRRCARTRPVFAGRYALLRCPSAMQVHPLVAVRWMRRLRGFVVIAANDGYLPGRVNFAIRTTADVNLVDLLRSVPLGAVDGEYGFGHPAATGGSLAPADFARLLEALGFPAGAAARPARSGAASG